MGRHLPSVYCSGKKNRYYDTMKVLSSYCHSIVHQSNNSKGTAYGVILSLTADSMYISVFPGFWKYLPIILVQELLMMCLLLTLTLCSCRYLLHMQAMILMRSCRLWALAIISVDGCCLYIIIHNCILHGTWL